MNAFLKNLGLIILLLGVVCLVVYNFSMQANWLLVAGIVTEIVGAVVYVVTNRFID